MEVAELLERARPVAPAGQRTLPLAAALEPLLPGGLQRGTTLVLPDGSRSLLLALLAAASGAGSWCALVGVPDLSGEAAHSHSLDLRRLAVVPHPGERWATVAAALLDGVDVVVLRPPPATPVRPGEARRLAARARTLSRVLVVLGPGWPEPPDLSLEVTASAWEGLGRGYGHLDRRRVEVEARGRRGATRPRRAVVWFP